MKEERTHMLKRNKTFHLMLAPDCRVEALAPGAGTAITLAREALPFLQQAAPPEMTVRSGGGEDDAYALTCLLCGAVNPAREGATALVAMQEHQMEQHDLPAEAFQSAVRLSLVAAPEEIYVWAFPPAVSSRLRVSQACYLLATKYRGKPAQEPPPPNSEIIGLAFKSQEEPTVLLTIYLVEQDEYAWYGYATDTPRSGDPLVWPRGEWERVDPANTLE
jgi:hypothetical protein